MDNIKLCVQVTAKNTTVFEKFWQIWYLKNWLQVANV